MDYARTADEWRCDECGHAMLTPLFCDGCGADYPERRGFSPFAVLGLPVSFDVDDGVFDRIEVQLTQRLHPDVWQGKGDRLHKRAVLAQSAVNEALDALRDPFERARTLLKLAGDETKTVMDQAFLIEQLELQEDAEDGDEARRKELKKQARRALKSLKAELGAAFADSDLPTARRLVDTARYWRNLDRAARGQAPH